jgi:hypothetical protein
MILRILLGVGVLLSLLFCPVWVTIILLGVGLVCYKYYFEILFFYVLQDLLFASIANISGIDALIGIGIGVGVVIAEQIKERVRYER